MTRMFWEIEFEKRGTVAGGWGGVVFCLFRSTQDTLTIMQVISQDRVDDDHVSRSTEPPYRSQILAAEHLRVLDPPPLFPCVTQSIVPKQIPRYKLPSGIPSP